jgi:hypothetical protein
MQMPAKPAPKKVSVWRIIVGVMFGMSVIANIFMLLALVGAVAFLAVGYEDSYREDVIQSGPRDKKIAVVTLDGVIDDKMSEKIEIGRAHV